MCVVDRRSRRRRRPPPFADGIGQTLDEGLQREQNKASQDEKDDDSLAIPGDPEGWLSSAVGNRIRRMTASPGKDLLAQYLLDRIFDVGANPIAATTTTDTTPTTTTTTADD